MNIFQIPKSIIFVVAFVLTFGVVSLIAFSSQIPALDAFRTAPPKYIITRSDVHEVLSKLVTPDDKIVFLSDFDGTLADINPDSKLTKIRPEAKSALEILFTRPNYLVGFISGREMFDLQNRVGIENVTYSGNHGMEIIFPNKTEFHYPITSEMMKNCSILKTIVKNEYADVYGGWVEDKNISLVYHYHDVPEHWQQRITHEVSNVVRKYGFNPMPAHEAIEIKPPVVWSKGHAALLILKEFFGKNWDKNNRVFYLGDDTSDEAVMEMLKGRSTTFRITQDPDLKTHGTYKMQSVDNSVHILEWLVDNTNSN